MKTRSRVWGIIVVGIHTRVERAVPCTMSRFASEENTILYGVVSVDISHFDFNDPSSRVSSVKTTNIALAVLVVTTTSLRAFCKD
jgi:hypothetical protein